METSDFLTILGLALAVWALIPNKERRFILLFFSKFEISLFLVSLLFIHYLMSFDWLRENWIHKLSIFTSDKGIPSEIWAYITSLFVITYPIIKVSQCYFSKSRLNNLIELYETYLKENEIDLLVNFINKYHIDDVKKYLKEKSVLPDKDPMDIVRRRQTDKDKKIESLTKPKRMLFAASVYRRIIQNEIFIKTAANKYPELFAKAISGIETPKTANQDLVKLYIECLFENKNQLLVQELKIMNGTESSVLEKNSITDIPILSSLFTHTEAAAKNHVWYPVGEETIRSLKYDDEQKEFLLRPYDNDLIGELWNYKIYLAIIYFNYMVRETIYVNSKWHMWLFYYQYFIKNIIDTIPEINELDHDKSCPSFGHYMITEEISNMLDWLRLSKEQNNDNRIIDTIRCLSDCLNILIASEEKKISKKFKLEIIDSILSIYFEFSDSPDNIGAKTSRIWLEKLFLNPSKVNYGSPSVDSEYLSLLSEAWGDFDKVPYEGNEDNGSIQRFTTNVIQRLGIE